MTRAPCLFTATVAPAALAVAVRLFTGPHPIDDAYITFRYARNLADGLGLVYNPGEWVLGTTAPLWALALAAARRLGADDLPAAATVLAAVCDGGSAAILALMALAFGWRPLGAALVGLAWAVNPMSVAFAAGGMETSLFVFLALLALTLAVSQQPACGAAVAGAATLVRPESLLIVGIIVLGSRHPRTLLAGCVPVAAAALALAAQYGSPVPQSVAAKQVAYLAAPPWTNLATILVQAGLPGWSTYLVAVLPSPASLVLGLAGAATLGCAARVALPELRRRQLPWQSFAGFATALALFYVLAGVRGGRLFPWYLVPLIPFQLLVAAAALARAARGPRSQWLAGLLVLWQLPAVDVLRPFLPAGAGYGREALYLQVGEDLRRAFPPDTVVAAPEIGALGYASGLRILDTVGLVSPAAVGYYPLAADEVVADNAIPPRLVEDLRPDVVVTLDQFARLSLLRDAAFQQAYRLDRTYPAAMWDSQALFVFRRAGPGAGEDARSATGVFDAGRAGSW